MTGVHPISYDREHLRFGIVHFGVGNFHRSHQAMYLDRLLTLGEAEDWAICGIGVLPSDAAMRDALRSQDLEYTLIERAADGTAEARRIGSIVDYLFAPDGTEPVIQLLADPGVRIVSLTITEGGYGLAETADASSVFGLVAAGLAVRRQRGVPPFTIMSCDNLPENGAVARASFVAYARRSDPELAEWMLREVPFPSSMVDRITPVTTDAERIYVEETFGVLDAWPVVCEPFVQWVLEDRFSLGRPALDRVGVQFVEDVAPYEKMKLRLLNASHQALAYFGGLLGYRQVHDAVADPLIQLLLTRYMREEAEPTLDAVPGIDLAQYQRTLIERFTNPYIGDTVVRLATDGSDRLEKFLVPVIHDQLASGGSVRMSAGVVAAWAAYWHGILEGELEPVPSDRGRESIASALERQKTEPLGFLRELEFLRDLAGHEPFARQFASTFARIDSAGPRAALSDLVTE